MVDLQHAMCMELHGKLHYVPVKSPQRVLDLGTGNGSWAIEYGMYMTSGMSVSPFLWSRASPCLVSDSTCAAERHARTTTLGIDLSWLSPCRVVPDNCSFDIANGEDPWDFLDSQKLDLVFIRFLGWLTDFQRIFSLAYENLQPGAWIEVHEWLLDFKSRDGSLKGTALELWCGHIREGEHFHELRGWRRD